MTDPMPTSQASPPLDAIRELLDTAHVRNASAPLDVASADGVFPAAVLAHPRTVVADTRWLGADIGYACRNDQRTSLITAANQQAIRILCSQHVLDEVVEHRDIWSTRAKVPVSDEDFMRRFHDEYLPLLRVVPDDAVPTSWLSPSERQRLDKLALSDTDDIPSVKLALVTRSLYLSKDKPALRAVYGDDSELAEHAEWLERLKAGGDAAELMRLLGGTTSLGYAVGYGAVAGARRLYGALGPATVLIGAAAAYGGWQWIRHPSRQVLRSGIGRFLAFLAEVSVLQHARDAHFDAALPAGPTLEELALTNPSDDVLGRACINALASEPRGHASAQELATQIRSQVPCSDAKVRAILRTTGCFVEVYRGRWQVGQVSSLPSARHATETPRLES